MKRNFALLVTGLALSSLLTFAQTAAQVSTSGKLNDPDAGSLVPEPGFSGVPQLPDLPPVEIRGFGRFEEAPEGTRQPGNAAMRYLRRGADALREALRRLELANVEDDAMAMATARRDCRLLIETLRENNPSDILGDDLDALAGALADPRQGTPGVALARLQRSAMDFRFLYPSLDLEAAVATLDQLARDGKTEAATAQARALRQAVLAGPVAKATAALEQAMAEAQQLLDARQAQAARRQIRSAQEAATAVHAAGLLGEAIWYLGRTVDALSQGLPEIAHVSVGNASVFMDAAAQESSTLREQLVALRADTTRLAKEIADGAPVELPRVRAIAERLQSLPPTR